jgi:hypothetical protein
MRYNLINEKSVKVRRVPCCAGYGRWINKGDDEFVTQHFCRECQRTVIDRTHYADTPYDSCFDISGGN